MPNVEAGGKPRLGGIGRAAIGLLVFACVLVIGWKVGGAWLWRCLVPAGEPVPLRVLFSNDSGGPVRLQSLTIEAQRYVLDFDLPRRLDHGSFLYDFAQEGYVAEVAVAYTQGGGPVQAFSFKADARRDGECELRMTFDPAPAASGCGPMTNVDSVPWEPEVAATRP
jgi:hypothetical protein